MKQRYTFLLAAASAILFVICPHKAAALTAAPVDSKEPSFAFELTADGEEYREVSCGDIITLTLTLTRSDSDEPYTMYAMQDEIQYDSSFFELVPDSENLAEKVNGEDLARTDGSRAYYMNYLSMSGGMKWKAAEQVGSIRLKVTADSGTARITSQKPLVSRRDGTGSFACSTNEVLVVVSSACTVNFDSSGGSEVPEQTVQYGEKIREPEPPTRKGFHFSGWYADIDHTTLWNFEQDTVKNNMTLYAGWAEGEAKTFPPSLLWLIAGLIAAAAVAAVIARQGKKRKDSKSDKEK